MFVIKVNIMEGWIGMQKKYTFLNKVHKNDIFL